MKKDDYETLVKKIHHTNQCWHLAKLFPQNKSLTKHFLERKNDLQIKLMEDFRELVQLEEAPVEQGAQETLYSIRLLRHISGYSDACHIPKRVLPLNGPPPTPKV